MQSSEYIHVRKGVVKREDERGDRKLNGFRCINRKMSLDAIEMLEKASAAVVAPVGVGQEEDESDRYNNQHAAFNNGIFVQLTITIT